MLYVSHKPQPLIRENSRKVRQMLPENISSPGGKEENERNSWWYKIFCLETFWNCSLATVGKSLRISHLGSALTSSISAPNKIQSFVKKTTVNHFSVSSSRWQLDLPWNGVRAEPCTVGSAVCLRYAAPSLPGSRSHLGSTALSSKASMEDLLRTTWKHSSMERERAGSQWSIDHSPGAATQPVRPVALPGSLWVARFPALTNWLLECWGGPYKSTMLVLMTPAYRAAGRHLHNCAKLTPLLIAFKWVRRIST